MLNAPDDVVPVFLWPCVSDLEPAYRRLGQRVVSPQPQKHAPAGVQSDLLHTKSQTALSWDFRVKRKPASADDNLDRSHSALQGRTRQLEPGRCADLCMHSESRPLLGAAFVWRFSVSVGDKSEIVAEKPCSPIRQRRKLKRRQTRRSRG